MVWDEQRQTLQMVDGSFGADEQTAASYQISAFDPYSNAARVFSTGPRLPLQRRRAGPPGILQDYVDVFGIAQAHVAPADDGRSADRRALHLANKRSGFTVRDIQRAEQLAPRIGAVCADVEDDVRAAPPQAAARDDPVDRRRRDRLGSRRAGTSSSPASREACGRGDAGRPDRPRPRRLRADRSTARTPCPRSWPAWSWRRAAGGPGVRAYVVGPEKVGDPGRAVYLHAGCTWAKQRIGTLAALRARAEPFLPRTSAGRSPRVANLSALAWASERYQQQRAELARMRERQRIADDLHDDVAQIIFAAQLNLDAISRARRHRPPPSPPRSSARGGS